MNVHGRTESQSAIAEYGEYRPISKIRGGCDNHSAGVKALRLLVKPGTCGKGRGGLRGVPNAPERVDA